MNENGILRLQHRAVTNPALRPFMGSSAEYEAVVAIENANHPDALQTVKELEFWEKTRDPKYLFQRIVVEQEGKIVAHGSFGETWWAYEQGKFNIAIGVDPNFQDNGISEKVYEAIIANLGRLEARSMECEIREDQHYLLKLLSSHKFQEVMRLLVSQIDLEQFNEERFEGICQSVQESGIWIGSAHELVEIDPDWQRGLWNLEWEILKDVPTPDPLTRMDFDLWKKRRFGSPNFTMDGTIVAADKGKLIGMSSLWLSEAEPKKLYTGLTGVIRSHRRRGIATAMKVRGIQFARSCGATEIETDNEQNNPMYSLNQILGFRPKPALLHLKKMIEPGDLIQAKGKETITAFT